MKLNVVAVCVAFFLCIGSISGCQNEKMTSADFNDDKFAPGQVWFFYARPGEDEATLTVQKVEKYDKLGVVVHISVDGIALKNSRSSDGVTKTLGHLPLSKKSLEESIGDLIGNEGKIGDLEGYRTWKKEFDADKAGVFTITLKDILDGFEQAFNQ